MKLKQPPALHHQNICTIHEIDETDDSRMFISMDCYEGETLKQKITQGPIPMDEVIDLVSQIAEGLSNAHEAGMVHCDIKPRGNVASPPTIDSARGGHFVLREGC